MVVEAADRVLREAGRARMATTSSRLITGSRKDGEDVVARTRIELR